MSTKRMKWYLPIGLVLGILCCVFGCVNIANKYVDIANEYNKKYPSEKSPIRTLSIQINENQREELFSQLRKFSEKHYLEFHLSFYKNKEVFFVEMYGQGLQILALSRPVTTTDLYITFFEEDPTNPPSPETVDELFSDLKSFINEIPNVTISEEK